MYFYITEESPNVMKNNKTAKGVKKDVIKNEIKHSDYLNVLFQKGIMYH